MKLRTELPLIASPFLVNYDSNPLFLGSCFTKNMAEKLSGGKIDFCLNPFGIVYNPLSISLGLKRLISGKPFLEKDLILHQERWNSFMHHGSFSGESKKDVLENINLKLQEGHQALEKTKIIFITLGSAFFYRHNPTGKIVSNCHKIPQVQFTKSMASPKEIFESFMEAFVELFEFNKEVKIVFTVSPVRHIRDGIIENTRSKAALHLGIAHLLEEFPEKTFYFPAYEWLVDELRDYRFYAEDMVHPSKTAVEFIWEKFKEGFFSSETKNVFNQAEKINRGFEHRPLNSESKSFKTFGRKHIALAETFMEKHPYISFGKDIQKLESLL